MIRSFHILVLFVLLAPVTALGFTWADFAGYEDTAPLEAGSGWYAGILSGFPHTYELSVAERTELQLELLVPAGTEPRDWPRLMVVREAERGVSEVLRLTPVPGEWHDWRDWSTNDAYRVSPVQSIPLEPGSYLVEVSSSMNQSPYVLRQDGGSSLEGQFLFGTLSAVAKTKQLHGKSVLRVIESPRIFIPLVVLIILAAWWYRRRTRS